MIQPRFCRGSLPPQISRTRYRHVRRGLERRSFIKMKRPFARRPPCIALGRGAASNRKSPRAENVTRKKSWEQSACPTASASGVTKPNISTRKPISPSSTKIYSRNITAAPTVCISSKTMPPTTRSRKSLRTLPNTSDRSQCFSCHPIRPTSMQRSASGITHGNKALTIATSSDLRRYVNPCSQLSLTCNYILKESKGCGHRFLDFVCRYISTRTCSNTITQEVAA